MTRPSPDPDSSLLAWLAFDLRFYRERFGQTQSVVARAAHVDKSRVSRWEAGTLTPTERQLQLIDGHWHTGGHFRRLLMFAHLGHNPTWFKQHVQFEARSAELRIYEASVLPGLLQTPDYARALISADRRANVEADLQARLARQEILNRDTPPTLRVLLDYSTLDRPVGGYAAMREQLAWLLKISELPNVVLRAVARAEGAHLGLDGSFKIMKGDFGRVGYVEAPHGGRLIQPGAELQEFVLCFEEIGDRALTVGATADLIRTAMEHMHE